MIGISELAIVVGIASFFGFVARQLKQPSIIAYLAAGACVAWYGLFPVTDQDTFELFSDLGVTLLLFLVGLEVNYSSLRLVGISAVIIGLGQVIFTSFFGFLLAQQFGYDTVPALYIAVALTFSSTIIIVKLLSEKRDLHSLYGKIAIGFMLIQDAIAVLLLVALSGIQSGAGLDPVALLGTLSKGIGLLGLMVILGRNVLPIIFDSMARSSELLFVASLAWVLGVAALVERFGFSIEIGGFLAGLALANSAENFQIVSRIRSLRDFFILIFFVTLGAWLVSFDFSGLSLQVAVFSLFVLVGNPLIVIVLMGFLGYRRRTSFFAGVTVAQVSEFSLILAALGLRLGHISENELALIAAVAVATITLSSYSILYAAPIERRLHRLLGIFERRKATETKLPRDAFKKQVVLAGAGRMGESIAEHIPKKELLIVDFDPDIVSAFSNRGYTALLGDITDEHVAEASHLSSARLIISTSPDIEDSIGILDQFGKAGPVVIVRATNAREADVLYARGARYVIYPHRSVGHLLGKSISGDPSYAFLDDLRKEEGVLS